MPVAVPRIAALLAAFVISAASPLVAQGRSGGIGHDVPGTLARDSAPNGDASAQPAADGSAPAKVIHSVPLQLSDEARAARFSGSVLVHLTVDADGLPQDIQVVRSVGMGMDEKAIEAAKQFRFQPATRDGKPVASGLSLELQIANSEKLTVVHSVPLEPTDEARHLYYVHIEMVEAQCNQRLKLRLVVH